MSDIAGQAGSPFRHDLSAVDRETPGGLRAHRTGKSGRLLLSFPQSPRPARLYLGVGVTMGGGEGFTARSRLQSPPSEKQPHPHRSQRSMATESHSAQRSMASR